MFDELTPTNGLPLLKRAFDSQYAERDADLESIRVDARWPAVRQFPSNFNRYFEANPANRTVLVLPRGYTNGTAIPAILWMHGLGSRPEDFVDETCQKYADELNVAIVSVSGTLAREPRRYVWADDAEKDAKRLRDAIAEVADQVTIKKGQVITFGFSQGAQDGLEVRNACKRFGDRNGHKRCVAMFADCPAVIGIPRGAHSFGLTFHSCWLSDLGLRMLTRVI